jgi:hypothetical protein
MKKLLTLAVTGTLAASLLALSTPAPARAAQEATAPQLEARVTALEAELALEKKRHDETRTLLDSTLVYLEKQSKAAQALLTVLDESEREGFAVGENYRSRQILLAGMRAYWGEEQGVPKPPAPPAPEKPAAPTRAKAPARQ